MKISKPGDFKSKVKIPDCIYEISCSIDLMQGCVEIPANCIIRFQNGDIRNGKLIGNNTTIENSGNLAIFRNVEIGDTPFQFINDKIFVDWFYGKDDSEKVQHAIDFSRKNRTPIDFLSRKYVFTRTVNIPIGQCLLRGTGCGGEYKEMGTRIVSAESFSSEYKGKPLFYITGESSNQNTTKGMVSGRVTGISFSTGRRNDVFQFYLPGGPSRPFYIDYCQFSGCATAIRVIDNGTSTALGFLYVEHCTMTGNKWNIIACGRHSLLGLYFRNNVAEQCDGNINLGYTEDYSKSPYSKFSPKQRDYAASANIVICDNLLEGTVDCIYINGGKCVVNIERNYFETSRKQFVVLSFSTHDSYVTFNNNYISKKGNVFLRLDNCSYVVQEEISGNDLSLRMANKM